MEKPQCFCSKSASTKEILKDSLERYRESLGKRMKETGATEQLRYLSRLLDCVFMIKGDLE